MKPLRKSDAQDKRPRLLVVAGPNGSGKTSVTEQGLRHEWFRDTLYINPDNLARDRFGRLELSRCGAQSRLSD